MYNLVSQKGTLSFESVPLGVAVAGGVEPADQVHVAVMHEVGDFLLSRGEVFIDQVSGVEDVAGGEGSGGSLDGDAQMLHCCCFLSSGGLLSLPSSTIIHQESQSVKMANLVENLPDFLL